MEIEQKSSQSPKRIRLIPNLEQIVAEEAPPNLHEEPHPIQYSERENPNLIQEAHLGRNNAGTGPEHPLPPNPPNSRVEVVDIISPPSEVEEKPKLSRIYGTVIGPSIDEMSLKLGIDNFTYELDYKCEMKKSNKREVLKKKKKLVEEMGQLNELRACISKHHLKLILQKLEPKWKFLLEHYLTYHLVSDLYSRKLTSTSVILTSRNVLLKSLKDPEVLEEDCHFDNNTVKNFSKGFVIFYTKYMDELDKIYETSSSTKLEDQGKEIMGEDFGKGF